MGLDCVDCQGTAYPIFDLSQVGFGQFMPFTACRRCVERGRNCDRQRPCDSCTDAGEADQCDNAFLKTEASKKRLANCIRGRLDPPPGPLYYLAHGYGANGVNDVKDGSRLEHWIGPFVESYAMSHPFFRERLHGTAVTRQRLARLPRSVPPHAAPGTPLATLSTSQLTVDHIVGMINQVWPGAYPINTTRNFAADQLRAIQIKGTQMFLVPAGGDNPPTAAELALAINPNPNPGPVRINRVVPALQVVLSPQVAAEAAAEADDEEGTGEDDNGDNDGANNAVGPSTQGPRQIADPAAAGQQFGQFIFPQHRCHSHTFNKD
ncbi:hypothetical protein NLG97_g11365 [Lecanicillium saksenae]|uniref:Uncharacterized protein n=1 Tax=Lecanicillium saksenae TaxID=468837 RepID=A0ACC1QAL5_9HYPO|nr:hypothetical protein NLG97_g11365 [Lecanicillium saksenae]